MTAPTRRLLLGVSPVLLAPAAIGTAAVIATPDTALVQACNAYLAVEKERDAAFTREGDAQEAGDKEAERREDELQRELGVRQHALLNEIVLTRAITPEERAAKALVAMDLVQTNREGEPLDYDHAMLWSLAEDMAGREMEAPV